MTSQEQHEKDIRIAEQNGERAGLRRAIETVLRYRPPVVRSNRTAASAEFADKVIADLEAQYSDFFREFVPVPDKESTLTPNEQRRRKNFPDIESGNSVNQSPEPVPDMPKPRRGRKPKGQGPVGAVTTASAAPLMAQPEPGPAKVEDKSESGPGVYIPSEPDPNVAQDQDSSAQASDDQPGE